MIVRRNQRMTTNFVFGILAKQELMEKSPR